MPKHDMTRGQLGALDFLRAGQTSFFRLPVARPDGGPLDDALRGARAAILGVPWDGGVTIHPGARHAPFAVRQASVVLPGFGPDAGVDVFRFLRAVDAGNVAVTSLLPELAATTIESDVADIMRGGAAPFLVGGDHSITLPALRAVAKARGPVGLVHVDAHADTSDGSMWGGVSHHGTWLRQALSEGLVDGKRLIQIGLRGPWKDDEEHAVVHAAGGRIVTVDDFDAVGGAGVAELARRTVGDAATYLTIDVDAIDPAFAPGTGTPVAGGLTSREVLRLVRALARVQLVGMDVVELCPVLDVGGATALLAAHLLFEGLAIACQARAS
jgi:agmatinase